MSGSYEAAKSKSTWYQRHSTSRSTSKAWMHIYHLENKEARTETLSLLEPNPSDSSSQHIQSQTCSSWFHHYPSSSPSSLSRLCIEPKSLATLPWSGVTAAEPWLGIPGAHIRVERASSKKLQEIIEIISNMERLIYAQCNDIIYLWKPRSSV